MEFLKTLSVFPYVVTVAIAAWITIYYFVAEPTKRQKLLIPAAWGVVLGVLWYFLVKPEIDQLILGFFASAGFYDYIIKWLLSLFNANYEK